MAYTYDEQGLSDLVAQLKTDARNYAQAEVDYYKAIATVRGREAKSGLILAVPGALLALVALIGLEVGLILSLSTLVGPLAATGIVVVVTLVIAGILAMMGAKHLGRAFGGAK